MSHMVRAAWSWLTSTHTGLDVSWQKALSLSLSPSPSEQKALCLSHTHTHTRGGVLTKSSLSVCRSHTRPDKKLPPCLCLSVSLTHTHIQRCPDKKLPLGLSHTYYGCNGTVGPWVGVHHGFWATITETHTQTHIQRDTQRHIHRNTETHRDLSHIFQWGIHGVICPT